MFKGSIWMKFEESTEVNKDMLQGDSYVNYCNTVVTCSRSSIRNVHLRQTSNIYKLIFFPPTTELAAEEF